MSEVFQLSGTKIVHEKFDDETVIVNLETGRYYNMLNIGSAIWALAMEGLPQSAIAAAVAGRYPADAERIAVDVAGLLNDLKAEGLVVARPAPAEGAPTAYALFDGMVLPALYFAPHLQKYVDMEDMLALDPIHDVDDIGWPVQKSVGR
jgi:hypothetical protein